MITTHEALQSLTPNAEWNIPFSGELQWHSTDIPQPTDSEIQAEIIRLQELYVSQEYARNRKAEYDKLNQFEMQFDDNRDDTTTWPDAINEIKMRYPK